MGKLRVCLVVILAFVQHSLASKSERREYVPKNLMRIPKALMSNEEVVSSRSSGKIHCLEDNEKLCFEETASATFTAITIQAAGFFYEWKYPYNVRIPDLPKNVKTKFLVFTPSNPSPDSISTPNVLTPSSDIDPAIFDSSLPLKFVVHGWGESSQDYWMTQMKDAFLKENPCNVIVVDWGGGATYGTNLDFVRSVSTTRLVGRQIAMLVDDLMQKVGFKAEQVHLVGFSLGAQCVGNAGMEFAAIRGDGTKIQRITGLDPAGPCFENEDKNLRLDPTDAVFVDSIHTDANHFLNGGRGIIQRVGHVDHYANNGAQQPGCKDDVWTVDEKGIERACDHFRGPQYYIETISKEKQTISFACPDVEDFYAGKCFDKSSSEYVGYDWKPQNENAMGPVNFFETRSQAPFIGTQYKIAIAFRETTDKSYDKSAYGSISLTLVGSDGAKAEIGEIGRSGFSPMSSGTTFGRVFMVPSGFEFKEALVTYTRSSPSWYGNGWSISYNLEIVDDMRTMKVTGDTTDDHFMMTAKPETVTLSAA